MGQRLAGKVVIVTGGVLLDAPPMESLDSSKYCKDLDGSLRTERGGITTTMVS